MNFMISYIMQAILLYYYFLNEDYLIIKHDKSLDNIWYHFQNQRNNLITIIIFVDTFSCKGGD